MSPFDAIVKRWKSPPVALLMGGAAGSLAALSFLPMALPLVWQMVRAEEALALRHTQAAAYSIDWAMRNDVRPDAALRREHGLLFLLVSHDGVDELWGPALDQASVDLACNQENQGVVVRNGRAWWAVGCVHRADSRVVTAVPIDSAGPARPIIGLAILLALGVGIITSLGVLRALAPLSQIGRALVRVGEGERGVVASKTGLDELDQLVDRLNAAARSMEDREDAILGRIEVVQEMARIVAHEVRNPLQSMELLTSLIVSEEDPKERREIGQSIHHEVRSLEQVVNRLLRDSSMKGSLGLQITNQSLGAIVGQVVTLRRPEANSRGIRLVTGVLSDAEGPFDATLIKRCVENLVLNALQAVPLQRGEVSVSVLQEHAYLLVAVDDNGPGVDPELGDQIFERNVTTKPSGTGLGLALVKGVIDAHGGYIRYARSPLGGARFEARIPLTVSPRSQTPFPTSRRTDG